MFSHRFRRPKLSEEDEEFFRVVNRGTFKGLFLNFGKKLTCFLRMHVGPLRVDGFGFYNVCDRCGHYEKVEVFAAERKRLP